MDDRGSFQGLAFGLGTSYDVLAIEGLNDLPDLTVTDIARAGHGMARGKDWLAKRVCHLDLQIRAPSLTAYDLLVDAARAAFIRTEDEVPFYFANSTRMINARVRKRVLPTEVARMNFGQIPAGQPVSGVMSLEIHSTDPRIYDAVLSQPTLGLPVSSGGMTFPATFNLGFGSAGSGGALLSVNNVGNFQTWPVLTILGPATNPQVRNETTGKWVKFSTVLGAGDSLVVDADNKDVKLFSAGSLIGASRRYTLTPDSTWWDLPPGVSQIRFLSDTYDPTALLTVAYRSAWV